MRTFSKILLALALLISFGCDASGDDDAVDAGSTDDTDTGTGTGEDTGEDTTEGLDDCEIMEQTAQNAVDDYCVDFLTTCCYCQCSDPGEIYDSELYFDDGICTCLDNPDPAPVCEDAYLAAAEACAADIPACYQNYYNNAESGCLMTPLE